MTESFFLTAARRLVSPGTPADCHDPGSSGQGCVVANASLHATAGAIALVCLLVSGAGASAQQATMTFVNPCERGPVPNWETINRSRSEFVAFLQSVRPTMPIDVAERIASDLCDDMSLVGDSGGLTRRVRLLIREAGY